MSPVSGSSWRLPSADTSLRIPTDPDAMAGVFGEVLAVQRAKKVAEAREPDDELVAQVRLQELAGEQDRSTDHVRDSDQRCITSVRSSWNPPPSGLLPRFVDRVLPRAWTTRVPQSNAGKGALLPGDCRPVYEPQEVAGLRVVVVIVKELFE